MTQTSATDSDTAAANEAAVSTARPATRTQSGPGIAETLPHGATLSHFRATRLAIGDVIMSVTQVLNVNRRTPEELQVRVFRASADSRQRLHRATADELLGAEGGLCWMSIDLRTERDEFPFAAPPDRIARITEFLLGGESADERRDMATVGVGDWLLGAVEHELLFAGWYAIGGDARAFTQPDDEDGGLWPVWRDASDYGRWAARWLAENGYAVSLDEPGEFHKVLNPASTPTPD